MSPALMPLLAAIGTSSVALAALIVGLFAWMRSDMRRLEDRLVSRIEQGEARLVTRSESDMRGLEDRLVSRFESDMRGLEARFNHLEAQFVSRTEQLEARFVSKSEQLETRLAAVGHGQAKLEGLLEGLREAIVARAA